MIRDDAELRALYARLRDARPRGASPAALPPETIQALAEGTYQGADREELLDQVLRDARMHAEFLFFRQVARGRPEEAGFPVRRVALPLALAAAVVLAVALGTRFVQPGTEPVRGGVPGVVTVGPGASTGRGAVRFIWRAVRGAVDYRLEVTGDDGALVLEQATADTTYGSTLSAGSVRWWVTARRDDGTTLRSPVQVLQVR